MKEKAIVVTGCGTVGMSGAEMIVNLGTVDIYIGPPTIDIVLQPEPMIPPLFATEVVKEPKKRDWEQREKRRRKRRS